MEHKEIDYKKLNDRIVEQACASVLHLTEDQTRKLIQDKFDRAYQLREALRKSNLLQHTGR